MNIVGIVTEFNPFHAGHQHLIDTIKEELHPDGIVAIMSGDYVQRGIPAIYDKYMRTRKALVAGVDVVLELPVHYALSSAEQFAYGAVSILHSLGIIDTLAFGVETDNSEPSSQPFWEIADFFQKEPEEFKERLKYYVKEGNSYPKARFLAFSDYQQNKEDTSHLLPLLQSPNNILGVEYAKAIKKCNSLIQIYPIKREGNISAHGIRNNRKQEKKRGIYIEDFSSYFQWKIAKEKEISNVLDFSTELKQRLLHVNKPELLLPDVIALCKTKQYTYTRISRCIMRYLLEIDENTSCNWQFARVLGLQKSSSFLLKEMRKRASIPIVQKYFQDSHMLSAQTQQALQINTMCHDRYAAVAAHKYPGEWKVKTEAENGVIFI